MVINNISFTLHCIVHTLFCALYCPVVLWWLDWKNPGSTANRKWKMPPVMKNLEVSGKFNIVIFRKSHVNWIMFFFFTSSMQNKTSTSCHFYQIKSGLYKKSYCLWVGVLWDLDGLENAVQFHRLVCEMLVFPCCCFLTVGMLLDVVCLFYLFFFWLFLTAGLLIVSFFCLFCFRKWFLLRSAIVHAAKL